MTITGEAHKEILTRIFILAGRAADLAVGLQVRADIEWRLWHRHDGEREISQCERLATLVWGDRLQDVYSLKPDWAISSAEHMAEIAPPNSALRGHATNLAVNWRHLEGRHNPQPIC
jgi:hypothetical protein